MVEAYRATSSGTDLTVFLEAGIPGLNEGLVRYHTPLDNVANLNPGSLQKQGDTAWPSPRRLFRLYGPVGIWRDPLGGVLVATAGRKQQGIGIMQITKRKG